MKACDLNRPFASPFISPRAYLVAAGGDASEDGRGGISPADKSSDGDLRPPEVLEVLSNP